MGSAVGNSSSIIIFRRRNFAQTAISRLVTQALRFPRLHFGRFLALGQKKHHSFLLSCVSAQSEAAAVAKETQVQASDELSTVRVKFQLQRACFFGQRFFLVGEDSIFGHWEPANAIPLQWSEDHIWTAELELPVGKTIQFKFILKEPCGEVEWQPGPDRTLQTWETKNVIVISEDWENEELQKIVEEERTSDLDGEVATNLTGQLVSGDNITRENGKEAKCTNAGSSMPQEIPVIDEDLPVLVPGLDLGSVPEFETEELFAQNGKEAKCTNAGSSMAQEIPVIDEDLPVLVPGLDLDSVPEFETEELFAQASSDEAIASSSVSQDKVDDVTTTEQSEFEMCNCQGPEIDRSLHDENQNPSDGVGEANAPHDVHEGNTSTDILAEEPQSRDDDQQAAAAAGVSQNDIGWGAKVLHKFILNMGFSKKS